MKYKLVLSSLALAIYFQGRELFFFVTGIIGFKPTWLSGLFQVYLLFLFLYIMLLSKKSRKRLFSFHIIDTLYLIFFILAIADYKLLGVSHNQVIPEADIIVIFLVVYYFALFLARSLDFEQLKLAFKYTNLISIVTSLAITLQFLIGNASFVNNGGRLANGLSDNPINVGYLGTYTVLSSIVILLDTNIIFKKIILTLGIILGSIVFFLTGTRSAFIFLIIGLLMIFSIALSSLVSGNNTKVLKPIFKVLTPVVTGAVAVVTASFYGKFGSLFGFVNSFIDLNNLWSRLSQIFVIGTTQVADQSIYSRYQSYDYALQVFQKNPIMGGGFYASGYVHNSFLQVMGDFGVFGIFFFTMPFIILCFLWISKVKDNLSFYKNNYIKSDLWTVDMFVGISLIEAICQFSFHGDPYRSYIPLCGVGILIAYSKINFRQKLKLFNYHKKEQSI